MTERIVLYQEWPGKVIGRKTGVDTIDEGLPTKRYSVFPASQAGLKKAIAEAERKDAVVIKLSRDYYNERELRDIVKKKLLEGKYIKIFKPIVRI